LDRIGALYAIEDEIRNKPAELRLDTLLLSRRPLLDDMRSSLG
jgi:hypothetical protein